MIITESENGDSKPPTVRSADSEAPASPPPYTPTLSSHSYDGDQKPLPTPPFSPPQGSMSDPNAGPTPRPDLPPRCNHLIETSQNSSVKGVWHVDTALAIPEALLAPLEELDGVWNEAEQAKRKRDKKGKKRSNDSLPVVNPNASVRPNLMLRSKNGSVAGEVHVVSSDGAVRPVLIVAEGHNGSVTLEVRTYAEQPLRVFATSVNGSVRVRLPQSFEGAVMMSTRNGSVKFSDPVKSHLTTFSSASNTTRGFIGDWQAANFGSTPVTPTPSLDPNADPPLPSTPADPFTTWTGPLVHLASHNGSVNLSFSDEEPAASSSAGSAGGFSSAFRGFMSGLFGGAGEGGDEGEGGSGMGGRGRGRGGPWGGRGGPWGHGGGPWGPGGGPWGGGSWGGPSDDHDGQHPGGPFGHHGGPFGRGGGPFGPGGGPFGPGGGPFGPGGGPFGRGVGPFCRGGSFGRRGGSSAGGSCRSRKEDGPSDEKTPGYDGESWTGTENANGYPMDKKDPI